MDMQNVIYAVAVLFIMGIVFAILLGVAAKVFAVEVDERIPLVRECLPGANCGGCGFPGCDGLAAAIATLIFLLVGALAIVNLKATRMKFD